MIQAKLTNDILKYITEIEKNRYRVSAVKISRSAAGKLRKNSKKKSSYASNRIEGNPLSEKQVVNIGTERQVPPQKTQIEWDSSQNHIAFRNIVP